MEVDLEKHTIREFVRSVAGQLKPRALVLDAGAGKSPYKEFFRHTNYMATDLRPEPGLLFVSNSLNIPLKNACCDAVLSTQVIEHVRNPQDALSEMHRVLKPGGKLFLTAPQSWRQHMKPHDYFRFTSFGLTELFRNAGFEINSIKPRGGYFIFLGTQFTQLPDTVLPPQKKMIRRIIKFPFYRPLAVVFKWLLPAVCFRLDFLDRRKDLTSGYACVCTKPKQNAKNKKAAARP